MCIDLYSFSYLFYDMQIHVNSAFSSSVPDGLVGEYRKIYTLWWFFVPLKNINVN